MELDPHACYTALRARDYRYDGRFFVAVKTTGIYCRPICPAKPARFENVRFYGTAAEAEARGFRPCMRCRPEAAAGSPRWNGTSATVSRALKRIDDGYLAAHGVPDLAALVGLGQRHLRSLFVQHVGVAPKTLADARRLDFAKNLIDTTALSMADVATASGFSSIRRFNDAIKRRYGGAPTELRTRRPAAAAGSASGAVIYLAYRPPYDWDWMLEHLGERSLRGVEVADRQAYSRSFRLDGSGGWLRVTPEVDRHRVKVEVFGSDVRSLMPIAQRTRALFDLNADPLLISHALSAGSAMRPLVSRFPGTRLPGSWDAYETAVKAIVGQLISVKAASSISNRLVARFGRPLCAPTEGAPTRIFPEPPALADCGLESVGLTRAKANAIRELSRRVVAGTIELDGLVDSARLHEQLLEIPGVGPWTADYVALKVADPDTLPRSDLVIARCLKKLGSNGDMWKPWRGYATHYLWRSYAQDRGRYR